MHVMNDDTIVAISTALGEGAIAVIRVSGKRSLEVADQVFRGKVKPSKVAANTAHFGKIVTNENEPVDQVILTVLKGPKSYTGEDTVEISCHGGIQTTRAILDVVLQTGTRQAEPGEFTKRAFLNGKLDLSQAEAVADMISAKTKKSQKAYLAQLNGSLANEVRRIRNSLLDMCSRIELQLDFPDEGLEISSSAELLSSVEEARRSIVNFVDSYGSSKIVRDGFSICIAGPPNVGKSSLFNALIRSDRAIVSEVPGTTRDFIEESIQIEGILFRLFDTAGIRSSSDPVEAMGISRSAGIAAESDAICLVCEEGYLGETEVPVVSTQRLFVHNKIDLTGMSPRRELINGNEHVFLSAKTEVGIGLLKSAFLDVAVSAIGEHSESIPVTSSRHFSIFMDALAAINSGISSLKNHAPMEFVSMDIRAAANKLGEITGEVTTEEVLNNIFSKFCIGK